MKTSLSHCQSQFQLKHSNNNNKKATKSKAKPLNKRTRFEKACKEEQLKKKPKFKSENHNHPK